MSAYLKPLSVEILGTDGGSQLMEFCLEISRTLTGFLFILLLKEQESLRTRLFILDNGLELIL